MPTKLRIQNERDLSTLLLDLSSKVESRHAEIMKNLSELTDEQVADLVDKAGHLIEWLGLA